jgi:hypothetical protein
MAHMLTNEQTQICTVKKGSTMKFEYFFKLANINPQSTGHNLTSLFGTLTRLAFAQRPRAVKYLQASLILALVGCMCVVVVLGDDNVFALADRKKSNGGSRGSRGSRAGKTTSTAESNDNVLYLRASSAEEKDAWVTELEQLCTRAQGPLLRVVG